MGHSCCRKERTMQLRSLMVMALMLAITPPYIHPQETANSTSSIPNTSTIHVDAKSEGTPFPHFWEDIFGSGRAILSLRESYRDDLRKVKKVTGIQAIRFHGIFMDEVGLFDLDASGHPVYNFSYIDQIYGPISQRRSSL